MSTESSRNSTRGHRHQTNLQKGDYGHIYIHIYIYKIYIYMYIYIQDIYIYVYIIIYIYIFGIPRVLDRTCGCCECLVASLVNVSTQGFTGMGAE